MMGSLIRLARYEELIKLITAQRIVNGFTSS